MAYVYRHIRLDTNQPFYIGISNHIARPYSKNKRTVEWKSVLNETDYEVEILFDNLSYDECKSKEQEFIKLYGRLDNGTGILVNKTDGGDGTIGIVHSEESNEKRRIWSTGRKHDAETLKKISEKQKGEKNHQFGKKGILSKAYGRKISKEQKDKLSELAKNRVGEKNPMFGKKQSQETKEKISAKRKGIKLSAEHKEAVSKAQKGKVVSEKTKEKLREYYKINSSPCKGKKTSEEVKQKIKNYFKINGHPFQGKKHSEATKEKIRQINLGKKQSEETKQKREITRALNKQKKIKW